MHELPIPTEDDLSIPEVGIWSRDKHHFLWRYLSAFTNSMKKKGWKGLHFLDLFAGAGIEKLKEPNRPATHRRGRRFVPTLRLRHPGGSGSCSRYVIH